MAFFNINKIHQDIKQQKNIKLFKTRKNILNSTIHTSYSNKPHLYVPKYQFVNSKYQTINSKILWKNSPMSRMVGTHSICPSSTENGHIETYRGGCTLHISIYIFKHIHIHIYIMPIHKYKGRSPVSRAPRKQINALRSNINSIIETKRPGWRKRVGTQWEEAREPESVARRRAQEYIHIYI